MKQAPQGESAPLPPSRWRAPTPSAILEFIQPGDNLTVVKLDRLGRSTRDVLNLVHELEGRGALLRVLDADISTAGPMGKMVLTVLGMVAEMELGFIRKRQRGDRSRKGEGGLQGPTSHTGSFSHYRHAG